MIVAAYPSIYEPGARFVPMEGVLIVDTQGHEGDWEPSERTSVAFGPDPCTDTQAAADFLVDAAYRVDAQLIVPLTEEAVLPCGLATTRARIPRGVDCRAARVCTDRASQRELLPPSLNPRWRLDGVKHPDVGWPAVVKLPASLSGKGTAIVQSEGELADALAGLDHTHANRLRAAGMTPNYNYVLEEFVSGHQHEVNGVTAPFGVPTFNVVKWDSIPVPPPYPEGLIHAAIVAANVLGLNYCGFMVQLLPDPTSSFGWRVVEVHCRIGEHPGEYYNRLSMDGNEHPHTFLCSYLRDTLRNPPVRDGVAPAS